MTFNEILEIQSASQTVDGWGQPVNSWSVTGKFFGRVTILGSKEFVSDGSSDTMQKTIAVTTYWRNDLNSDDRLVWQNETYDIVGLISNKRRNVLLINAVWTEGRA